MLRPLRPRRRAAAILAVLLGLPGAGAGQAPAPSADTLVSLTGVVRTPGYRDDGLLPGAVVRVRQAGALRSAITDAAGRYRVAGLRGGPARVTVTHVAVAPLALEVHLPPRGRAVVDLEPGVRAIPLAGLVLHPDPVLAEPAAPLAPGDPGRALLALRGFEATSGMAESGMAAALRTHPRDDEGRVADRTLFMRGSTVDARSVLLDGTPVLTPFHVAGLVPPFDPELIGGTAVHPGGAPARYQGGVSYLLELDTREPRRDRIRGYVGLDGVAARGVLEAPLPGGGGILLGGRGLHGAQERLGGEEAYPYLYRDLLARLSLRPSPDHGVRLTAFRNREGVRLALGPEAGFDGDRTHWGNRILSGRYRGQVGRVLLEIEGGLSGYDSELPLPWEDPVMARASQDRSRTGALVRFAAGAGAVELGLTGERLDLAYHLDARASQPTTTLPATREARLASSRWTLHGEWESPVGDGVVLRAGLRAERTGHDDRTRLAPRAGIRFLLGERSLLRLDAGRFHQFVTTPGIQARYRPADPEAEAELAWTPRLGVASASHLVVALQQELRPDLRLEVAAMAKGFRGLTEGPERSRTSGVEIRMAREGERFSGWLGYTLSWFWTLEGSGGSTRFDGRHLLAGGFRTELAPGLSLDGTVGYGAGLPFASVTPETLQQVAEDGGVWTSSLSGGSERALHATGGVSPLDPSPPDDFLRLDLELSWRFEPVVGGRRTELRPYFRALNALNRRDAMFYYFDRWRDDSVRPITERPFTPVLGLEWRF